MIIKKGTLLEVSHNRKGNFIGIADEDFDTEKTEFYPISLAQKRMVEGISNDWKKGETIPCRASLCKIKIK